ncbi:MAG: metalloregulator ArsR/SmtB family transcription factor [Alphaproteobacteria bacterium]|nr:metalloregulator ArsR/SmtB family transcription factor [Alphaproteobacteria bacterium]
METYSQTLNHAFHALSDPTRRYVVAQLSRGPASIKELAEPFDMGLPSFLKHIKVLETSGLITSEKSGRVRTCTLNRDQLAAAEKWFTQQRANWESRYENLETLLTGMNGYDNET